MNRVTHAADFVWVLLHGADAQTPAEALLLDGKVVMQVLKVILYDLHDERRRLELTPAEAGIVQRIRYLDAVLGWVKEQPSELVVMGRR